MPKANLTKVECDEIDYRIALINKKKKEMVELNREIQILQNELNIRMSSLVNVYGLDAKLDYTYDGSSLVSKEVEPKIKE